VLRKESLILIALLGITGVAQANLVPIHSRAEQNPTDVLDWGLTLGPEGSTYSAPQTVQTFNGNTVTVGTSGGPMQQVVEGSLWIGNFDYGENLLSTNGANGPMALLLSTPVSSFGFTIQARDPGPFTGIAAAFDTQFNLLGSLELSGNSTNLENGSALFLGLRDSSPDIAGIVIDAGATHNFAIDAVTFTPEPGLYGVLALGLAGLAGARRWYLSPRRR
jgi:hypothetical protein